MQNNTIKISCVSYTNSLPFLHGLRNFPLQYNLDVQLDHPSDCARKLLTGEVDLGLVPVASIHNLKYSEIVSDFCIGSKGNVASVLLLSEVPLNEIETILLDYQSVTSVLLVQILAKYHWDIQPLYKQTFPEFETGVSGRTAAVVIGDRALKVKNDFKYVYDLSGEWNKFTGLPFVFACWVSNIKLPLEFKSEFNDALGFGVSNIDEVIKSIQSKSSFTYNVETYLKENLNFLLDDESRKGLNLFLNYINNNQAEFFKGSALQPH